MAAASAPTTSSRRRCGGCGDGDGCLRRWWRGVGVGEDCGGLCRWLALTSIGDDGEAGRECSSPGSALRSESPDAAALELVMTEAYNAKKDFPQRNCID